MAWPPDVSDGQVILASHINAIKNSVITWQGDVNAGTFSLTGLNTIAQDAFVAATLQSGWTALGTGWPSAGLVYRKDKQSNLWLIGAITGGTKTDGTVITILPAGFRPGGNRGEVLRGTAGTPSVLILPDGQVQLYGAAATTWLTFNICTPLS